MIINLFTELCISEVEIKELINYYKSDMIVATINDHYIIIKTPEVMDPAKCTNWVSIKAPSVTGYLDSICLMNIAA